MCNGWKLRRIFNDFSWVHNIRRENSRPERTRLVSESPSPCRRPKHVCRDGWPMYTGGAPPGWLALVQGKATKIAKLRLQDTAGGASTAQRLQRTASLWEVNCGVSANSAAHAVYCPPKSNAINSRAEFPRTRSSRDGTKKSRWSPLLPSPSSRSYSAWSWRVCVPRIWLA